MSFVGRAENVPDSVGQLIRELEDQGWDVTQREVVAARRERGDRVEVLQVAERRLRYTLTHAVGDEDFRRVQDSAVPLRVVSRSYRETTVTAEFPEEHVLTAVEAAITAARSSEEA